MSRLPGYCKVKGCERPRVGSLNVCESHRKLNADSKKLKIVKPSIPLRKSPVRKVSVTNLSYGSDGTAYTNTEIAANRKRCYDHLDFDGKPPFCSAHGYQCSEWMLDHDHTIAQSACKKMGKTELIWDEGNIEFSCRTAHMEWESYKDGKFIQHKNFEKRMAFVKLHDPIGFEKRMIIVAELTKPIDPF